MHEITSATVRIATLALRRHRAHLESVRDARDKRHKKAAKSPVGFTDDERFQYESARDALADLESSPPGPVEVRYMKGISPGARGPLLRPGEVPLDDDGPTTEEERP